MSRLVDLRKRAETTKELQQQKVSRVRSAVIDAVNSSAFDLTALNHLGSVNGEAEELEKFASTVAEHVAAVVTDPVVEFTDACKARGLKESKIRKAVEMIDGVFGLCEPDAPYEDKLKAVAMYIHDNPKLYDEIALLG